MPTLEIPVDLTDSRAKAGRLVSINVPVLYPAGASASALSSATARGRQRLQALVEDGRSTIETLPHGQGADLTVTGRLLLPWSSVWALRQQAYTAVSSGAAEAGVYFHGTGPEDVAILDLEVPPVERQTPGVGNWYTDPTGESNPDGTINAGGVIAGGAQEGLEDFGRGVGAVASGVGEGARSAVGGFFGGLGLGWSIALLLVLVVAGLFALVYLVGGAGLL